MVAAGDRHSGKTPATVDDLAPGEYTVTFTREGWAAHTETISISANATAHSSWTFPNGVVKIGSSPEGAAVLRNGAKIGATPLVLTDQVPGDAHFEVALDGYDPVPLTGRVEGGGTLELAAKFRPENRFFEAGELDKKPEAINGKLPELPYYLTLENGRVELQLIVNRDGSVRDLRIVSATSKDFGKFTEAAVAKWQFRPGIKSGAPVNTRLTLPFVFKATKS